MMIPSQPPAQGLQVNIVSVHESNPGTLIPEGGMGAILRSYAGPIQ
jgi:hypothetical protein